MATIPDSSLPLTSPTRREKIFAWLERIGERANPILVKETRQALKSRQFTLTFAVVLVATWIWTLISVYQSGYERSSGPTVFIGYYSILAFALTLIVPYMAFRSLAQECEDRTYELLSITTITPQQIVRGKLFSACLQIMIYFSAVAPCMAFTYLLRGIDIIAIVNLSLFLLVASVGLSLFGLFMATISFERHWQNLLSVVLFLIVLFALWGEIALASSFFFFGRYGLRSEGFWTVMAAPLVMHVTSGAIYFYAATAQLTFPSDNRATRLRIAILIQSLAVCGLFAGLARGWGDFRQEAVLGVAMSLGGYWIFMGSMMMGESPEMSRRVQRSLPETDLGRTFLSWFFPGPLRGYVFVLVNIMAVTLLGCIATLMSGNSTSALGTSVTYERVLICGFAMVCYAAIYLALTRAGVMFLSNWMRPHPALGVLVGGIISSTGALLPSLFHRNQFNIQSHSIVDITSIPETIRMLVNGGNSDYELGTVILLGLGAALAIGLNLPPLARELRRGRVASPGRVIEDELSQRPVEPPKPQSPWDT